ncbi:hypothetical protein KSF_093540 [Reticulibacter mediterranei]|uniref:Pyrrolo-quinoline quinone repeat domain-containing protein n=1 Tax=Reticulibacter mediterranei TaxID=2778369 RepID=A0A8J3J1Z9_9CHLR|nr:PQQ-binding-like beta-propeller repeat protein [Reticulibacter mediterranei]GHO99306.1 hypothetical protein KSF_093540 [Reticulibacter mediterranei]
MRDNEQLFKPETVDEQIEQYASAEASDQDAAFDVQLMQTLQHIYRSDVSAEDRASLARARERITSKKAVVPPSSTPEETNVFPFHNPKSAVGQQTHQRKPSAFSRALSLMAAVLILGLILGSWAVVTHLAKQQEQKQPVATNGGLDGTQQNLYIGRNHMVYKLDGRTGKMIWQAPLDPKAQELTGGMHVHVFGGVVYVIMSRDIYALNARTGQERWHTRRNDGYSYAYDAVSDGRIYLYGFGANEPGTFSAVSTQNGAELWHNKTFHTGRGQWFFVVHGTLYVLSDQENFYAFDAATGVEHWHFTSPHRPSFSQEPVVEHGIVYFSMGIGNRLVALNEQTGRLVWQQQIPADYVFSSFQLVNGIVYASSSQQVEKDQKQYEQSQKISAFDAKTGAIVWASPPGYTMLDGNSIAAGLLIAQGKHSGVLTLNAFRVKDGTLAWQMNDPCSPNKCFGGTVYMVNGTGYLFELESAKTDIPVKIKSFDWQSGKLLAEKPTILTSTSIGMSNGIVYQQASTVSGSGKNQKFTDSVYAIRLSDGSVLWQYSPKDAGNGMNAPDILAP